MEVANAIGLGLPLALGRMPMPLADASPALAIPLTQRMSLTTQTHQAVQILLITQILLAKTQLQSFLLVTSLLDFKLSTTIHTTAILSSPEHSIRSTKP